MILLYCLWISLIVSQLSPYLHNCPETPVLTSIRKCVTSRNTVTGVSWSILFSQTRASLNSVIQSGKERKYLKFITQLSTLRYRYLLHASSQYTQFSSYPFYVTKYFSGGGRKLQRKTQFLKFRYNILHSYCIENWGIRLEKFIYKKKQWIKWVNQFLIEQSFPMLSFLLTQIIKKSQFHIWRLLLVWLRIPRIFKNYITVCAYPTSIWASIWNSSYVSNMIHWYILLYKLSGGTVILIVS